MVIGAPRGPMALICAVHERHSAPAVGNVLGEIHGHPLAGMRSPLMPGGYPKKRRQLRIREGTKELAGEPGFEPGLTESESVGLPLTYSPTAERSSLVETPEAWASQRSRLVPLAFRGAFYHISPVDQGAKAGFLTRRYFRFWPPLLPSRRSKRIWRFGGKLLQSRQRQNRAGACCGRKVFARRGWTSK